VNEDYNKCFYDAAILCRHERKFCEKCPVSSLRQERKRDAMAVLLVTAKRRWKSNEEWVANAFDVADLVGNHTIRWKREMP
jgi:hypothetical protein